jgi:DNA helicase HerA-like ATPase
LAEGLSNLGVPVFLADIKGDLTGISQVGSMSPKLAKVLAERGIEPPPPQSCPTTLWDVFGEQGHPVRATISDMGPLLLGRMLNLNETQAGVLQLVFKVADDNGLLLLDLKDLRAMLQHVGDNASQFTTSYGNISPASIGAIQRGLLQIEEQGGDRFFGEPMLNISDFMQTVDGKGVVNILAADKLMHSPRLYATFLLWMLSELFETLPEVGDLDKPKLVFFFDEAHLLFKDAPTALVERIELVVRLVRSKGVGVYFVTQNPLDIPDTVLGQLGNRVQHALRAFTPRDQKAVKSAADTMRANPGLDIVTAITELAVGEALISLLDEKGRPGVTQRVFVVPPGSQIGPITPAQRQALISQSLVAGVYEKTVDRESAHEKLKGRAAAAASEAEERSLRAEAQDAVRAPRGTASKDSASQPAESGGGWLGDLLQGSGRKDSVLETVAKSAARTIGSSVGREIIRGVLGSLLGGSRRR